MTKLIRITPEDNVAVAITSVSRGTQFLICENGTIRDCVSKGEKNNSQEKYQLLTACDDIPQGHKIAVSSINKGEQVIKYGFSIGHATEDVEAGSWVHSHNMATNLTGEEDYCYEADVKETARANTETFEGYLREDGRAGVRNEIWIIPAVGCVNDIARKLAEDNQDLVQESIDGLYAYTHPFGCSQTGEDHAQTRKLLAALARHPNAGAVLVLSLGCENLTREQFQKELGEYDSRRVKFLICQQVEDELSEGRRLLQECADYAGMFTRQRLGVDKLVIGMKCGGSDGLSGITANPAVGRFSDILISQGGSTVLTEVPEMFGAEGGVQIIRLIPSFAASCSIR